MSSGKEKAQTLDALAGGGDQSTDLDGDELGASLNSGTAIANQSFPELPDLAIKNILKYIRADSKENDFDEAFPFMKKNGESKIDSVVNSVQNVILKCRLVSKMWNDTIEDTSKLMKKITFPVRDPQRFLNLAIVKNRKIRSIKLTNAWPLESKVTKDLVEVFSNTVEKIHFAYNNEQGASKLECEFFELILAKCNNIEEIIVTASEGQRPSCSSSNPNDGLFGRIETTIELDADDKIQHITIDANGIVASRVQGITNLLLKLPNLKEIKLVGSCYCCSVDGCALLAICKGLLEYLNNFKDCLQLKKLGLPRIGVHINGETNKTLHTLLILCGKRGIVFDGLPTLDLLDLVRLVEASALDSSNQRPLFIGELDAELAVWDGMQNNFELLCDLNIRYLRLRFFTNVLPRQLRWIRSLPQLKALDLFAFGQDNTASESSVGEFENGLLVGLPTLEAMQLRYHVLTPGIRWEQDFPNLKGLSIDCCKNTPSNIIAQLTVLGSLSSLQFVGIEDLADIAFTADCNNRYSSGFSFLSLASAVPTAPAIACFKALTFLEIYNCGLLTDACVINGIAKSGTLNELKISYCKEITLSCLDNLDCDVFYLSSSKEKTIVKGKKNTGCCAFSEKTIALY